MMEKEYFQPEDDGLSVISEMHRESIKDHIVVCIVRDKKFPLVYLKIAAVNEKEAIEIVKRDNPSIKVLRAYRAK